MEGAHSPRSSTLSRPRGTVPPELPSQPRRVKSGQTTATEQRTQSGEHTPAAGDALNARVAAANGVQLNPIGDHIGRTGHQHRTPHRLGQLGVDIDPSVYTVEQAKAAFLAAWRKRKEGK